MAASRLVPSDVSSTEKQLDAQEGGSGTEATPSSSKMIDFEFSNGHPCGPHVPTSVEDEQYVEYPLDNLAGFPCDVDEEERMFMEAVIESLKDLETTRQAQPEQQSNISIDSSKASQKVEKVDSSSSIPSRTDVDSGHDFVSQFATPDSDISSSEHPVNFASSAAESSGSTIASARSSDTSAGIGSSFDGDMGDRTKATVTVVKNPSSNIMDGLLRRWDLNFFKNR